MLDAGGSFVFCVLCVAWFEKGLTKAFFEFFFWYVVCSLLLVFVVSYWIAQAHPADFVVLLLK